MVSQHLGQSQLEATYSAGEVTEIVKRGWLGVTVVVIRPKVKGGLCSAVGLAA